MFCFLNILYSRIMFSLFLTAIILICLDSVYLTLVKKSMITQVENVQKSKLQINIFGFISSYLFLVIGLYFFIIRNKKPNYLHGAFLGMIIYGVYDMTNLATFHKWSYTFAIQDILWGSFLFGFTTFLVGRIISSS